MVGWAGTLLGATTVAAVVNRHTFRSTTWEAGVRQGCPLAPAMYLFVPWALRCWHQSILEVGLELAGQRDFASHFANDCVDLLKACTQGCAQALQVALATFGRARGQQLNPQKSTILPMETPPNPLPATLGGFPVGPTAKTLGITFTKEAARRRQQQQEQHSSISPPNPLSHTTGSPPMPSLPSTPTPTTCPPYDN